MCPEPDEGPRAVFRPTRTAVVGSLFTPACVLLAALSSTSQKGNLASLPVSFLGSHIPRRFFMPEPWKAKARIPNKKGADNLRPNATRKSDRVPQGSCSYIFPTSGLTVFVSSFMLCGILHFLESVVRHQVNRTEQALMQPFLVRYLVHRAR